ncbi:MAG TPA: hypothetical protein VG757_15240 [Devosia sp.]|nr:hypothetical protein [Devosia sp.]
MFRIAALVAGALAGFVASLILALGGLEVTATAFGGLGERQLALARFGLIFIANLSLLGAGVSLALPRAGAILLFLAGAAWAGAALYLGHKTDLVLFGPPGLALLGCIFAIIGDIRARRAARAAPMTEPRAENYAAPDPYDVAPTSFRGSTGAVPPLSAREPLAGLSERDFAPSRLDGRSERKAAQTTPTPSFRELDEDEEEYEPSLLRRVGGGITNLLSFGLYAAAAASVLLVIYNLYQRDNGTALVTNPTPKSVSSVAEVAPPPSSSFAPVLAAPAPVVVVTPPAPSSSVPPPAPMSTAIATPTTPSSQAPEPIRVVGEPAPEDAVPAVSAAPQPSSSAVELEPSSQPSSEPVAVAEAAPLPKPDFVDNSKVAPVPATMSPQLATARRAGTFDNVQPDSFAVAPAFTGSDI